MDYQWLPAAYVLCEYKCRTTIIRHTENKVALLYTLFANTIYVMVYLKPHDLYLILYLQSLDGARWTYASASAACGLSASEANAAVKRALRSGLMREAVGAETNPQPHRAALMEFMSHGVRYAFPAEVGSWVRGVPTAFGAPGLEHLTAGDQEHMLVWPSVRGTIKGLSLTPLHAKASVAVHQAPRFHVYLALADILRQASPRGREVAAIQLKTMIDGNGSTPPPGHHITGIGGSGAGPAGR